MKLLGEKIVVSAMRCRCRDLYVSGIPALFLPAYLSVDSDCSRPTRRSCRKHSRDFIQSTVEKELAETKN